MATKEMRAILAERLGELMERDDRIVLVDADLSRANGTLSLREKFLERCIDVGVAEANMTSIAAGMASYGMVPVIGSFCPFASRRICDQLTISVLYAKRNVKIIGSDPGISAELNGGTHMSVEDIGVLRSIPGMVIFEPVDGVQLAAAMEQVMAYDGAVYIRLFRKAQPDIFGPDYKFDLFGADTLREGKDVTIFASGIMVHETMAAAEELDAGGVDAQVINIHTIKPIDSDAVIAALNKTGCAVTAENHNVIGGLYSAVCETIAGTKPSPVVPVGIQDCFGEVGFMPYLKEKLHMQASDIAAAARKAVRLKY